jgi:hypothetical protein
MQEKNSEDPRYGADVAQFRWRSSTFASVCNQLLRVSLFQREQAKRVCRSGKERGRTGKGDRRQLALVLPPATYDIASMFGFLVRTIYHICI